VRKQPKGVVHGIAQTVETAVDMLMQQIAKVRYRQ
jgi:hypothetical protein